jgi:hypothetical protein
VCVRTGAGTSPEQFAEYLREEPAVVQVWRVAADIDAVVRLACASLGELDAAVSRMQVRAACCGRASCPISRWWCVGATKLVFGDRVVRWAGQVRWGYGTYGTGAGFAVGRNVNDGPSCLPGLAGPVVVGTAWRSACGAGLERRRPESRGHWPVRPVRSWRRQLVWRDRDGATDVGAGAVTSELASSVADWGRSAAPGPGTGRSVLRGGRAG